MNNLEEKLKLLPPKPGVYLFKDGAGEIIYVGKAINLRNRVRSYFAPMPRREALPKTEIMISQIADLEYIVVSNEAESLILENTLIKKHQPRFNVRLRDDKNYQFIKVDYQSEIPQIYPVRQIDSRPGRGAKYFGPYTSGLSVRNTLRLINQTFSICRNKKVSAKPCFAYHLGRCPGVCFGQISVAQYRKRLRGVLDFLRHRQQTVLTDLQKQMQKAAADKQFEKAANFRDKIRSLRAIWEKQKIITAHKESHDYLGMHLEDRQAVLAVMAVREGRLIGQEHFMLDHEQTSPEEVLERFIGQYYAEVTDLPKTVLVPKSLPKVASLETALSKLRGQTLAIIHPQKGRKAQMVKLAEENAVVFYRQQQASFEKRLEAALPELQILLKLPAIPKRIEGYDISNIQGSNPVGSMVVFQNAKPNKSQYKKFIIRRTVSAEGLPKADDFAMMEEMLQRRFAHLIPISPARRGTAGEGGAKEPWPAPDLIVIDGGKGQLNVAFRVLEKYNLRFPVIGLAKRLEEIFLPREKNSLILPPDSPILFLLQQIRDEAHRFAITFHRKRRSTLAMTSKLDDVAGIGPLRRKKLLAKFGDIYAIKQASLEDLVGIVGQRLAKKIKEQI